MNTATNTNTLTVTNFNETAEIRAAEAAIAAILSTNNVALTSAILTALSAELDGVFDHKVNGNVIEFKHTFHLILGEKGWLIFRPMAPIRGNAEIAYYLKRVILNF